jgi:hypothetical protein
MSYAISILCMIGALYLKMTGQDWHFMAFLAVINSQWAIIQK